MKITFNVDPQSKSDIKTAYVILDAISNINENKDINSESLDELVDLDYEDAWRNCSWEIVEFAIAVLVIGDGTNEKGTFAFFSSLLNPESQSVCTILSERVISSRVGRTAVICRKRKIKDFRLMEIAVRRKDQVKRVYVETKAKEVLLKLLHSNWSKELETHFIKNGKKPNFLQELLPVISD